MNRGKIGNTRRTIPLLNVHKWLIRNESIQEGPLIATYYATFSAFREGF